MSTKKKISIFLLLFAFVLTLGGEVILSAFSVNASAKTVQYSNVIDDLKKDSNFNESDYPVKTNDYSLKVIQIAEGSNDELFVYVYQPGGFDFSATKICIYDDYSATGDDFDPEYFPLERVSRDGVFHKYLVKNFSVKDKLQRYYNIVSIYRNYISGIDSSSTVVSEKVFSVAQQWCAYTLNNQVQYKMHTFNVMPIEITTSGYLRFYDGITFNTLAGIYEAGDAHFIAFNAEEYKIEHIYNARLGYKIRTVELSSNGDKYGEWSDFEYVSLTDVDRASIDSSGIFGAFAQKYSWNRISNSLTFVQTMEDQGLKFNSSSEKEKILNSQFVFSFLETSYDGSSPTDLYQFHNFSEIESVGVLEIYFHDVNQNYYHLGVVSDLVGSEGELGTATGIDEKSLLGFPRIILLIILILLVLVFWGPIKSIFDILFGGLRALVTIILSIITLPFRLIWQMLFKRSG